jgi:tight adherence protein C
MLMLILPTTFAVATFLVVRAVMGAREVEQTGKQVWQRELMGQQESVPAQRRRRRESLRSRSIFERIVQAPPAMTKPMERMVNAAGMSDTMTGASFVGLSVVVGVGAVLLWLVYSSSGGWTNREAALTLAAGGLGLVVPWIVLSGRATRRRDAITGDLPDFVDLLTVSVEAGLALEAALSRVSERGGGPLATEIRRTLSEISLGRQRRDALRALGVRTDAPAIVALVNSLNHADQSGMELGPVLRAQSDQVRMRRRQRAEETAMKAPTKMLFPLIVFIFPSIFVVLLGPAAISFMETFGS